MNAPSFLQSRQKIIRAVLLVERQPQPPDVAATRVPNSLLPERLRPCVERACSGFERAIRLIKFRIAQEPFGIQVEALAHCRVLKIALNPYFSSFFDHLRPRVN